MQSSSSNSDTLWQPTLKGALLTVLPMSADHHGALLKAASDPLIWEQHPERDRYKPDVFQRYLDGAIQSAGALVALDNETGEVLGASRYYEYDAERSSVAVGYTFLVRACWAKGYNNDLKRLMLDYAFRFVDTVIFHVGEHNYRSQKAAMKTGAALHLQTPGKMEFWLPKAIWLKQTTY